MVTVESITFVEGKRILFSPCRRIYITIYYLKKFNSDLEGKGNFSIRIKAHIKNFEKTYLRFDTIDECVEKANELLTIKNKKQNGK